MLPVQEFVFLKHVRLFQWNVESPDHHPIPEGQILFFIRSLRSPATSHLFSFSFPFNLECLASANNVEKLAYEAVLDTYQFILPRTCRALAKSISAHLLKNYSFGLDAFSNPDAPKVLIAVEVNTTRVLNLEGDGIGEVEIWDQLSNGEADSTPDEEFIVRTMRNLLGVPVFSLLNPSDVSQPPGLTQVPGLESFEPCCGGGSGALAADEGTCSICLEEYSTDSCRKTPCSHVFHGGCIAQWLWRKRSCPLCRSELA